MAAHKTEQKMGQTPVPVLGNRMTTTGANFRLFPWSPTPILLGPAPAIHWEPARRLDGAH